jgi:uncharacterized protein YdbL (DUF1318 family)
MSIRKFLAAVAVLLSVASVSGAALAQSAATKALVDSAKAAGLVGEQNDGLLGFVKSGADAATRAAVSEINAGRSQLYRQAAAKNGVTETAAGAAAFQTVVSTKLKAGEYYQNAAGSWVRK